MKKLLILGLVALFVTGLMVTCFAANVELPAFRLRTVTFYVLTPREGNQIFRTDSNSLIPVPGAEVSIYQDRCVVARAITNIRGEAVLTFSEILYKRYTYLVRKSPKEAAGIITDASAYKVILK